MDSPFYLNLVQQTLQQTTRVMPNKFTLSVDYDLIKFEDGYEKPSRDVFYSKYNELLRNIHMEKLRSQRNEKLRQSDFSMLPDYRLSRENEEEWKAYRQSLRDIPETVEDPENPVWPEPPQLKISTESTILSQLERDLQTVRTDLEEQKQKVLELEGERYEQNKKIELLEMSHAALIQRIQALENM